MIFPRPICESSLCVTLSIDGRGIDGWDGAYTTDRRSDICNWITEIIGRWEEARTKEREREDFAPRVTPSRPDLSRPYTNVSVTRRRDCRRQASSDSIVLYFSNNVPYAKNNGRMEISNEKLLKSVFLHATLFRSVWYWNHENVELTLRKRERETPDWSMDTMRLYDW